MTTKVAFPTDEHYPFADYKAVELAQNIVHDFNPDVLIRGSDALDFYSVSSYLRSKDVFSGQLADEIEAWKKAERAWSDVVDDNTEKPFLVGNHEARLQKYVLAKAPELEGLEALKLPNLLDFKEFGIRMAYNNEKVVDGQLLIKHGTVVRKYSAYTAKAELEMEKYGITTMSGHTHRGGVHMTTTRRGMVAAYECFCLCNTNPSYTPNPDWQQGIALATVRPVGVQVDMIPFYVKSGKYYAYWHDKEYRV